MQDVYSARIAAAFLSYDLLQDVICVNGFWSRVIKTRMMEERLAEHRDTREAEGLRSGLRL